MATAKAMAMQRAIGIDVGGSSIKAGLVDTDTGSLQQPEVRCDLPQPSTPDNVLAAIGQLAGSLGAAPACGIALPAVVQHGVTRTASNIDRSWLGFDARSAARELLGGEAAVLNDADAAGLAEMRLGAGRGSQGCVLMLTLGTGIGTALFVNGALLPNTELGHLQLPGVVVEGERYAAARTRTVEQLDWPSWAARLNRYIAEMERLLWPDLVILGGAVAEHFELYRGALHTRAELRRAHFCGQAGLIGAALAAVEGQN